MAKMWVQYMVVQEFPEIDSTTMIFWGTQNSCYKIIKLQFCKGCQGVCCSQRRAYPCVQYHLERVWDSSCVPKCLSPFVHKPWPHTAEIFLWWNLPVLVNTNSPKRAGGMMNSHWPVYESPSSVKEVGKDRQLYQGTTASSVHHCASSSSSHSLLLVFISKALWVGPLSKTDWRLEEFVLSYFLKPTSVLWLLQGSEPSLGPKRFQSQVNQTWTKCSAEVRASNVKWNRSVISFKSMIVLGSSMKLSFSPQKAEQDHFSGNDTIQFISECDSTALSGVPNKADLHWSPMMPMNNTWLMHISNMSWITV